MPAAEREPSACVPVVSTSGLHQVTAVRPPRA